MADVGYIRGQLKGLPSEQQRLWTQIFEYLLGNLRVGLPGHKKRAENFQFIQLDGTTPATADTEFSIAHGIENAPRIAFPCLDLTTAGTQMIPLTNSRPADSHRVYLKSSSTSAAFTIFVEAR